MTHALYRTGDRVALVRMNDPFTDLAPGALGTVMSWQSDIGHLEVLWDNGSSLTVIPAAGDRVRPLGRNIAYPLPEATARHLEAMAGPAAFAAAVEQLSHPVVVLHPLTGNATWQQLRPDLLAQVTGLPARCWYSRQLGDDLQLVAAREAGFELRYNALAARVSRFVGGRLLNCYSEAVLCGRGADGAAVAIPHRHRWPLAMWMVAAGFEPPQLHVLHPDGPPFAGAEPRPPADLT
ncbi:DUF4314 domain-containing protein [Glycomyces sp. MUSA5-2]|uniref:DUF4314 domain-containing protein n=1 Tax=Glycomyces sp. MUSA5-2 TaxID=2053002 RepID=UPI0030088E16